MLEDVKKLGFGLMRLPKKEDVIDIEQTKQMVDRFMEEGFTYFDTAWAYAGSEDAIRKALVERYPRESFKLATKNAAWINCKTREDAINQFETSLTQTGAGYFDFYLLHNLGNARTEVFEKFDLWHFVLDQKEKGKIKHIGFSFHGTPDELVEILEKHPEAEFVQLQINYADWENPVIKSRECYEIARRYHKDIIVMEPVKGGMLASPPQTVKDVFNKYSDASYASWAVKFAANLEGVLTVLSGMSNIDQMEDNLSYMKDFKSLTEEENKVIEQAQVELSKFPLIPCTSCNYCAKVCPKNIGISGSFGSYNHYTLYNDLETAKARENWLVVAQGNNRSSECVKCGKCEGVCPQHIEIRNYLDKVTELFK